ncbi:CHRD domain-containing protein [Ramlibacter sp. XY19]|uniref:CHRD domain-containing protein n=1 Tax=Ramlibacter paludis TaxID=2908000 RepID=UPI0023DAF203|nr:CHRD domain-containing protein [Ramlibacter paludis]MCG2593623.1 CHRD domain-containing protein [Ramlibacter paludis]
MALASWRATGAALTLSLLAAMSGCAPMQRDAPVVEQIQHYQATLAGAQEVPPVASAATGSAEVDYHPRSNMLHWRVTANGLSGKATAAHIHGPAGPGQNAPAIVPLDVRPATINGQLRITPEQATQLESGQWYVNIHTAAHPDGEIRGQLRSRPD